MHEVFKQCRRIASRVVGLLLRSVAGPSLAQRIARRFSAANDAALSSLDTPCVNMAPGGFYSFATGPRYGGYSVVMLFSTMAAKEFSRTCFTEHAHHVQKQGMILIDPSYTCLWFNSRL